ncbi:MAG: deoxyribodipyrimidine photo-lyase [Bacteroidia bacterium]|nr:deoxyribodipyrimidine photo-lyase [Bacteroidia bacterium]
MSDQISFFWFRRDLRLHDNNGLYQALKSGNPVQAIFIFDTNILNELEDKTDRRLVFIHREIEKLNLQLKEFGSSLLVEIGDPVEVWKKLTEKHAIAEVYSNEDYEPYARRRDELVGKILQQKGISLKLYKDQVVFAKSEIVKSDGSPYTIFTPYSKTWKSNLEKDSFSTFPSEKFQANFYKTAFKEIPKISKIGFVDQPFTFPSDQIKKQTLEEYAEKRDLPSEDSTTRISVHLRFGTVSIRELFRKAWTISEKWTNELIWREFYMSILWHFPYVEKSAFKPAYDLLKWNVDEEGFQKWCDGKTGYPIVDAGMRELNETGFMHNRVRMITATFLTKYLLIDWRWGEAYFAKKLLDFELASNNGGWQWSAGTGVDAAPYFRIFSMDSQTQRFDPQHLYIKKWIPEINTQDYPGPMIDYAFARQRCLAFYKNGLVKK